MLRRVLSILLIIIILFLAGCWNAREINELAFVMGISLDQTDDGKIKVTVQMARPDAHSKTPTGGGGTQVEKPFWIATSTGQTIFEAIRNMAEFSSRRIFWSHNRVILISEKMARQNITEILDFFGRNPELRLRTWIGVSPGDAGEILENQIAPDMEKDPSTMLEEIFEKYNLTGKGYAIRLKDFMEDYLNPIKYPVAPRITEAESAGKKTRKISGSAVFDKIKFAGWLDERETRGLLWFKNQIRSVIVVVKCPFDDQPLSIEINGSKVNNKIMISNQQTELVINIKATGNLTEQSCKTDFTNPENLKALEMALASTIKEDIEATFRASQQRLGIDFPGISQILHYQHKQEWQQLIAEKPDFFKETKVNITVTANIPEEALFVKPLRPSDPAIKK